MTISHLLAELNDAQRQAATARDKHALVLAGAGTGKTKTIVARAAYLIHSGVPANRIQILTFTRRAASEIVGRVQAHLGHSAQGLKASTFHAWCMALIRRSPGTFGCTNAQVLDRDDQVQLFKVLRGKDVPNTFPSASTLCDLYSFARNTGKTLAEAVAKKEPDLLAYLAKMALIMTAYDERKRARDYLDYDDILELVTYQMAHSPQVLAWIASQQDHLLVDEMQDTNPLQWKLLDPLQHAVSLFCVGDDAQSIYAFRGADFKNVHSFQQRVPNSTVLKLEKNYRSTQEILDVSNWLLARSPLQYNKTLNAARGPKGKKPQLHRFTDEQSEARWIARDLQERHQNGTPWKHHMVLVRSSYAARFIEASFLNADIPYRFIGGTKLMESAHIRDVLAAVRVVVNPHDEIGWMRFLTLWDGLGETTAAKYIELFMRHASLSDSIAYLKTASKLDVQASTLLDSLSHLSQDAPAALNLAIAMLTPILEDRYANKEWDKRKKDIALLSQLAATYTSVSEFMTDYVLDPVTSSDAAHGEHQDIVTLITVHSAKGAECPVCYVSNVSSGAYPSYRSKGDTDAIEEERRVLYVALTRAQNELLITRQGLDAMGQPNGAPTNIPEGTHTTDFLEFAPSSLFAWHTHWDEAVSPKRPTAPKRAPTSAARPALGIRLK